MRKVILVILTSLSLCIQAAVVEQTYVYEFTAGGAYKSIVYRASRN